MRHYRQHHHHRTFCDCAQPPAEPASSHRSDRADALADSREAAAREGNVDGTVVRLVTISLGPAKPKRERGTSKTIMNTQPVRPSNSQQTQEQQHQFATPPHHSYGSGQVDLQDVIPDGRIAHTLTACTRCRHVGGHPSLFSTVSEDDIDRKGSLLLSIIDSKPQLIFAFGSANHVAIQGSRGVRRANEAMRNVSTTILPKIA